MAIALRQVVFVNAVSSTSISTSASTVTGSASGQWPQGTPLANSLLVAAFGATASSQSTWSVSDTVNGSWGTQAACDAFKNTNSMTLGIFSMTLGSGFTGPITVSGSSGGTTSLRLLLGEFTYDNNWVGSGASGSFDLSYTNTSVGTSTPSVNMVGPTSQAIELLFCAIIISTTTSITAGTGNGWTLGVTDATPRLGFEWQAVTSVTSGLASNFSLGASAAENIGVTTYKTGTAASSYTLSAQTTTSSQSTTPPGVIYTL